MASESDIPLKRSELRVLENLAEFNFLVISEKSGVLSKNKFTNLRPKPVFLKIKYRP